MFASTWIVMRALFLVAARIFSRSFATSAFRPTSTLRPLSFAFSFCLKPDASGTMSTETEPTDRAIRASQSFRCQIARLSRRMTRTNALQLLNHMRLHSPPTRIDPRSRNRLRRLPTLLLIALSPNQHRQRIRDRRQQLVRQRPRPVRRALGLFGLLGCFGQLVRRHRIPQRRTKRRLRRQIVQNNPQPPKRQLPRENVEQV